MDVGRSGWLTRLRRVGRMPLVSPRLWWRGVVFWVGAAFVAVVAADNAGAGRQLHLFRPDIRRAGKQRCLTGGDRIQHGGRTWQADCSIRR
jgi:hypothetical protein